MQKRIYSVVLFAVMAVFILSACGSAAKSPTPTQESLESISTAAAQTAFVQLTQLALTMPATATFTNTPTLTMTPTAGTPTATRTKVPPVVTTCAAFTFDKDVTIPDGTAMTAGQVFTKTWRVKNTGTCPWTTSFKLAFSSGEVMGGSSVALASAVAVGDSVDLSVQLTAPNKTGKLTGIWVLLDDTGQHFGPTLTVVISVGGTVSPSPTGSLTTTATPTRTSTPHPGATSTNTPRPTNTSVAPTYTPTITLTPVPPTNTTVPSDTPVPPTETATSTPG
jgi:hypothetical protein